MHAERPLCMLATVLNEKIKDAWLMMTPFPTRVVAKKCAMFFFVGNIYSLYAKALNRIYIYTLLPKHAGDCFCCTGPDI